LGDVNLAIGQITEALLQFKEARDILAPLVERTNNRDWLSDLHALEEQIVSLEKVPR
jgi:hypothetical protein